MATPEEHEAVDRVRVGLKCFIESLPKYEPATATECGNKLLRVQLLREAGAFSLDGALRLEEHLRFLDRSR